MNRKYDNRKFIGSPQFTWSLTPSDINNEGKYNFDGVYRDLIGTELRPPHPDNDDMYPVIAWQEAWTIEAFNNCPHCRGVVEPNRPVFAVGRWSVLPCLECNEWVWKATDTIEGFE